MSRVLIVAGTYDQAAQRAGDLGINNRDWEYAGCVLSLRGWLPSRVEFYSTYYNRSDWQELQDELQVLKSHMEHVVVASIKGEYGH